MLMESVRARSAQNESQITTSSYGSCPGFGQAGWVPLPTAIMKLMRWSSGSLMILATASKSKPSMGQESYPKVPFPIELKLNVKLALFEHEARRTRCPFVHHRSMDRKLSLELKTSYLRGGHPSRPTGLAHRVETCNLQSGARQARGAACTSGRGEPRTLR